MFCIFESSQGTASCSVWVSNSFACGKPWPRFALTSATGKFNSSESCWVFILMPSCSASAIAHFNWAWTPVSCLPVLRRSYHPRNHPICNGQQNSIAVAWRDYHAAGNDALSLNQQDMQRLGVI